MIIVITVNIIVLPQCTKQHQSKESKLNTEISPSFRTIL